MPAHLLNISYQQLADLYVKQKLSSNAISKIFKCNHVTILNYLRKYNIPRRSKLGNRKAVSISKEVLFDLYHNKKLTHKQIADKFGHSRYGIQRWMKIYNISSRSYSIANTKYPKYDFNDGLLEKAYLVGFRLGDLNVYKIRDLVQVRCSTTIKDQVNLLENLFKRYGNVHIWKAKRGTFEIIVLLNKSFNFLLPKNDKIADWILADTKLFLSFLAGYTDAEGCILVRKSNNGNKRPFAGYELQTYDKNIIKQIGVYLKNLGIIFPYPYISTKAGYDKRGIRRNKDSWRISIYRKDSLWRLLKLLEPFIKHKAKLSSLLRAKENIVYRNNIPYGKPISLL